MGCLLVLMAAISPRLVVVLLWLARPLQWDAAFGGGPILPILGIVFLPFTTLMYVLVYTPGVGLAGSDWIWVGLALAADLGHSASVAAKSGYTSGFRSTNPNPPA